MMQPRSEWPSARNSRRVPRRGRLEPVAPQQRPRADARHATQQWAVLGALSREKSLGGMSIGDLARYLMVSRQNLSGLISRMERDGHVAVAASGQDRRSRVVTMMDSGRHLWQDLTLPKIHGYYEAILADFSVNDVTHTLHYLLKILENMQRLDTERLAAGDDAAPRDLR